MTPTRICSTAVAAVVITLTVVVLVAPVLCRADVCTWDSSTGNWNDGARWSCGHEPGVSDTATISGGTVVLTAAGSVGVLNLNAGTLDGGGDLQVTMSFAWTSGTMGGTGTTTIPQSGTLLFTGAQVTTL
ncbi:MAG: hypothetical protein P8Y44_06880, partial [Acidobacteriota bacterium]